MSQLNLTPRAALTAFAAIVMIAGLTIATALARQTPKPIQLAESVTAKATIEEIDKANRLITLKGPRGNLVVLQAEKEVKRFDELQVGDVITATYTESLAVRVRKPGDPAPPKDEMTGVNLRKGGVGGTVTQQQTVTVTIEEIDRAAPSVAVKGPEGRVLSFRVRDVKNLAGLKVGDKVDITYTIALLLNADPAAR